MARSIILAILLALSPCVRNDLTSLYQRPYCSCSNGTIWTSGQVAWTINCTAQRLYDLPKNPCHPKVDPSNVKKFYFSNNFITCVPFNYFRRYANLLTLVLKDNPVSDLYVLPPSLVSFEFSKRRVEGQACVVRSLGGIFNRLTYLNSAIWMSDSCISSIRRHDFANLPRLSTLTLSGNNISHLDNEAFYNLPKLQILSLDANKLTVIQPQMFKHLPELYSLDLQYNRLERLDAGFLNVPMLISLYLSHNNITSIDSEAFRWLIHLSYLFLGDNPLSLIGPGAFQTMPNLMILYMYKTRLTVLKRDIMPNSHKILAILLFDSQVQRIEDGTFDGIPNITYLYLHQNNFTHLPEDIFENLNAKSLKLLSLTCNLQSLPVITRSLSNATRCPLSSEGINITAVDGEMLRVLRESAFECSRKTLTIDGYSCSPCKAGHVGRIYRLGYTRDLGSVCRRCPAGGYYQDEVGQQKCKLCVEGTFVGPDGLGTSASSCLVFPVGTNTTRHAGYRAGPCLNNYYRLKRFGECYRCKKPGAVCVSEILTLGPGYWWDMDNDTLTVYKAFAENIFSHTDSYDRKTVDYGRDHLPTIHKCRLTKACPGQKGDPGNGPCSEGSYGPLCELCLPGYCLTVDGCSKCPPKWRVGVQLIGFIVAVLLLVGFLSWKQTKAMRKRRQGEKTATWLDRCVTVLRIGIGFIQVMNGITTALMFVPWPSAMQMVGRYLNAIEFNVLEIVNPVCLNSNLRIDHLWKTVLFTTAITSLGVLVVFLYWLWKFHLWWRRIPVTADLRHTALQFCLTGILWIVFGCYPALSQSIIATVPHRSFSCISLNCTTSASHRTCQWYLKADVSLQCSQKNFSSILWKICDFLLFIPFGVPLIILALLFLKHRSASRGERITSPYMKALYSALSFLDGSYEPRFWYWEVLEMTRKLILTSGLQFFGRGSATELAMAGIIATAFAILQAYHKPMKKSLKGQQLLQLVSLSLISLNIMLGVLQMVDLNEGLTSVSDSDYKTASPSSGKTVVFAVLFYAVNGLFVFLFIVNIVRSIWSTMKTWIFNGLSCSICARRRVCTELQPADLEEDEQHLLGNDRWSE